VTSVVDVVIPAWNAERFIEEAITSVLSQTRPPRTIVVVDDGSTDGTAAIAAQLDPAVQVVAREHEGIGAARNAGIAATTSDLVAFIDADDVWLPTRLERQLDALHDDESIDAVFCLIDEFYDERDGPLTGVRPLQLGVTGALTSGALLRRELIERVGPFGAYAVGDWVAWWARARALGTREFHVQEVLVRRRIHGANNSMNTELEASTFLAIARSHLHEKRTKITP